MKTLVHEIRNQLAVAMANIEAFIDGKLEPNERRLRSVMSALETIDSLVDNATTEFHVAIPEPKRARTTQNICELIDITVEGVRAKFTEKQIEFASQNCGMISAPCGAFECDPVQIRQILNNLLLNAVLYTPADGRIVVDCRRKTDGIEITVEDNGPGLSDHDVERLFEPGYRGSAAGDTAGSGMGLPIVKKLLSAHGGKISVERRITGTAFTIHLADEPAICNNCRSERAARDA